MGAKRIAALATLAMAWATPVAEAAPPWSAPRDISARYASISRPFIGFGLDGTALLTWTEPVGPVERTWLATLLRDGSVAGRGRFPGALATRPRVYGRNRTVIVRERRKGTRDADIRTRIRLDATFGTTSRPLSGRTRRVAEFWALTGDETWPALAVSRRGEVAVAWVEFQLRGQADDDLYRVRVALGGAGRRFGRPRTVATFPLFGRDSQAVALAYGRRGELLVAYGIGRRDGSPLVAARVRRTGGRFGRAQVLGRREGLIDLTAAVASNGRMFVVWGSQGHGEEAGDPWVVRAAIRPPGRRFAAAAVLDPGEAPERVPGHVAVVTALGGSATAVWGNVRGRGLDSRFPVRTATASPHGGFGPVTELTGMGVIGSVATTADGRTLVTWTNQALGYVPLGPEPGDVFAALRPARSVAFGAPETVSSGALEDGAPSDAGFDPRTGRPVVIWPAGFRSPNELLDARIQLATRSG